MSESVLANPVQLLEKLCRMNRTPNASVRRTLRNEVEFGCPVDNCGNPYLEYHHFDPPWSHLHHHNPEGMIALCRQHHSMADGGAFTTDQLLDMKKRRSREETGVSGKLEWMRRDLLTAVGGNFYYRTATPVAFRGEPVVHFNRDDRGYMLLNVTMLSTQSEEPRMQIVDNDWVSVGKPLDLECPPSGRTVAVKYQNGDSLRIEFRELKSGKDIQVRHANASPELWEVAFPITLVEVHMEVGGTNIKFGPKETTIGNTLISGAFMEGALVGLSID